MNAPDLSDAARFVLAECVLGDVVVDAIRDLDRSATGEAEVSVYAKLTKPPLSDDCVGRGEALRAALSAAGFTTGTVGSSTDPFALVRVRKGKRSAFIQTGASAEALVRWLNEEYARSALSINAYGLLGLFDVRCDRPRRLALHLTCTTTLGDWIETADALREKPVAYRFGTFGPV